MRRSPASRAQEERPPRRGRRLGRRGGLGSLLLGLALLLGGGLPALAQNSGPGVGVTLALSPTTVVGTGMPITATLTVSNTSGGEVLTRLGFSGEPWEVTLEFHNQTTGAVVVSHQELQPPAQDEQPPQVVRVLGADGIVRKVFVTGVEVLAGGFSRTVTLANVRTLYPLTAGVYAVRVVLPFQRYGAIFNVVEGVPVVQVDQALFEGVVISNTVELRVLVDADGDTYLAPEAEPTVPPGHAVADCDDSQGTVNPGATEIVGNGQDDDCNPETPDVLPVAPATVTITVEEKNAPVGNIPVRLVDQTSACVSQFQPAPKHFASIWRSGCPSPANGRTNSAGQVVMAVAPGQYLAIVEHAPAGGGPVTYVGVALGMVQAGKSRASTIKLK